MLNTKYIGMASAFAVSYNLTDLDNKKEFTNVWDVVKTIPKENRVDEVKEMRKASVDAIKLDSARREYNKLLAMAQNYAVLPDRHVNLSAISYENLKRVMTLVTRVNTHYDGDITKLVGLTEVYEHGMSGHRYNNTLEARCKELSEALPAKQAPISEESALTYLDKVDITVKRAMLDRLMSDLGVDVLEVA